MTLAFSFFLNLSNINKSYIKNVYKLLIKKNEKCLILTQKDLY